MGGKNLQSWVQNRENGFLDHSSEYNAIYKKGELEDSPQELY